MSKLFDDVTNPAYAFLSYNIHHDSRFDNPCQSENKNFKNSEMIKALKESGPAYETYKPELHTKPMSLLGKFFVFCMFVIVFPVIVYTMTQLTITASKNDLDNQLLNQSLKGKTISEIFTKESK